MSSDAMQTDDLQTDDMQTDAMPPSSASPASATPAAASPASATPAPSLNLTLSPSTTTTGGTTAPVSTLPPPPKPKKRSAYFIFMDAKREEAKATVFAATGKSGVADVSKRIGELWNAASIDDRAPYITTAEKEKAAYSEWLEKWGHTEASHEANKEPSPTDLAIPVSKIRKIVKLDTEVKNLSKESLALITYSTELFVEYLAKESYSIASIQNRRKIIARDVLDVTSSRDVLGFLTEDIKDLVEDLEQEEKAERENKKKTKAVEDASKAANEAGAKGIENYFSSAVQNPE